MKKETGMDYEELLAKAPEHLRSISELKLAGMKPQGKMILGFGAAQTAGEYALALAGGKKKVFLVVDTIIRKLDVHKPVMQSLEKAGFEIDIYDKIPPEPHIEDGRDIQNVVRAGDYGAVIAVGGGSTIDMAKGAAMLATNPLDVAEYYVKNATIEKAPLPSILMPTTAGTGSEVSCTSVMASEEKKHCLTNPILFGTIALIDPLLTVTMPPSVTASTGLDTLSHAMEGIQGKSSTLGKVFGYKCAEYVFQYLPRAVKDPYDLEARYYMSFATVFGMFACATALYAHSMSYILTLDKHIPHGVGCGVTLPYTFMYNYEYVKDILCELSQVLEPGKKGTEEELASFMLDRFFELLDVCGMPKSLKEIGVEEEKIESYAKDLYTTGYRELNPRKLTPEDAVKLVRLMWAGEREVF